jgi:hypothetical protein
MWFAELMKVRTKDKMHGAHNFPVAPVAPPPPFIPTAFLPRLSVVRCSFKISARPRYSLIFDLIKSFDLSFFSSGQGKFIK